MSGAAAASLPFTAPALLRTALTGFLPINMERARKPCEDEFDKRFAVDRWELLLAGL